MGSENEIFLVYLIVIRMVSLVYKATNFQCIVFYATDITVEKSIKLNVNYCYYRGYCEPH